MALPLPELDSRRFADLADEARAAIPRRAPVWTDYNYSDPGITLTELVAAELDRLMYAVNRVTDLDRRTLLRLLGIWATPAAGRGGLSGIRRQRAGARVPAVSSSASAIQAVPQ